MKNSYQDDDRIMFLSYMKDVNKYTLNEQEEQEVNQQQAKQELTSQMLNPEAQKAMMDQAQKIFNDPKYKTRIDQALAKDGGKAGAAIESLLKQIQKELEVEAQKQIKESFDLQEGVFGRIGSMASGAAKKFGDVMSGNNTNTSWRQEAILKHFEKLKNNLGSHLKELQRDMETTSGTDVKVKDAVNRTAQQITNIHGITPTSSKFQDFRHKAGKFVQNVATGAILAAPITAVAAPIAAAVGLGGAAAAAVTAGLTGGSVSMLKDLINGQKPDAKRAAITAVSSAVMAGALKAGVDHFQGHSDVSTDSPSPETPMTPEEMDSFEATAANPSSVDTHTANVDDEVVNFKKNTGTDYNHASKADNAAVEMGGSMKDVGLSDSGSTFGASNIMRNFTQDLALRAKELGIPHDKLSQIVDHTLKNLTPEQLEELTADGALRTGESVKRFAQILALEHPELAKKGLLRFADRWVTKWH